MDRQEALAIIVLSENASNVDISKAYAARHNELNQRISGAPTEALRSKYQAARADLDAALAVLQGSTAATPESAAPSTAISNPLTATQMGDLPVASTDAPSSASGFEIGTVLGDRYEVRSVLGVGGMGTVYRVYDQVGHEEVALKVLLPQFLASSEARERFMNEFRITRKLAHPNIVRQFDVQRVGNMDCLIMELLEGETLRSQMERRQAEGKPYTLNEVKALLKPLCETLAYAHTETVHRDVKPENIWIGSDGKIKLMDFGIAKAMTTSQLTQTGTAMGTAYYMAPEQLKTAATVDGRADQYAVAVLVYELLGGGVPAGVIKPLYKQAKGIPRGFSDAVMQALSPEPDNRFADMAAFAEALKVGAVERTGFRMPWRKLGIAATVLLVLAGGGYSLSQLDLKGLLPQSEERKQAQYNAAVRLEGEVKDLAEKLRQRKQAAKQQIKDLEQRERSVAQSLRSARDGKAGLQQELEAAEKELELAKDGWTLRQRAVFDGAKLTELKGLLTLGSRQLQDKMYAEARITLDKAKPGYQQLLAEDRVGEDILLAREKIREVRADYEKATANYELSEPPGRVEARNKESEARQAESAGNLNEALDRYREAAEGWAQGLNQVQLEITQFQQQKLKAAREACAESRVCLMESRREVVLQPLMELEWTQSDSGREVNWSVAKRFCASKGGGWRLPSVKELQSLFDASGKLSTACGLKTCNVSPLLRLTSELFWSNHANGSSEGWPVDLTFKRRFSGSAPGTFIASVLCVRRY